MHLTFKLHDIYWHVQFIHCNIVSAVTITSIYYTVVNIMDYHTVKYSSQTIKLTKNNKTYQYNLKVLAGKSDHGLLQKVQCQDTCGSRTLERSETLQILKPQCLQTLLGWFLKKSVNKMKYVRAANTMILICTAKELKIQKSKKTYFFCCDQ